MNKLVKIEGMMCQNCKKHVENALVNLGAEVEVNLEEKTALLLNTNLDDEQIKQAIEEAGYEVVSIEHE